MQVASRVDVKHDKVTMTFVVMRNYSLLVVRIVIPCIILTFVSWAGFYIRIQALMPRFVSGFMSYVVLATFRSFIAKEMP